VSTLNRRQLLLLSLGAASSLATPIVWSDTVIVVINQNNTNVIDFAYVNKIYSGALRAWPDGSPVIALDHPEDTEVRALFSTQVLNRSVANMRAIWSQNIFTGRGLPPKVISVDSEVRRIVGSNKQAIGYLKASNLEGNLKVIER
jgi:ABC-type phosphate transport system substrate-binding protein